MPDTTTTTIEVPRLLDESPRAYAARLRYVTMGPQRSIDAVSQALAKSVPLMKRWSDRHGWVESARAYDDAVAFITIQAAAQAAAQQYRKDLEEYCQRYKEAGGQLFKVATVLLGACSRAVVGQVIKGADGKTYHLPAMELTPAALSTAMRALTIAADLEAHALRVAELLPTLTAQGGDDAE